MCDSKSPFAISELLDSDGGTALAPDFSAVKKAIAASRTSDEDYAVFVEQNWISNRAIVKKEVRGFTVQFEKPAPDGAKLDWMIVR